MTETTALAPLTKTVVVACPVERAFDLFTARLAEWWPLATHSVGGATALGVEMQCREGGRIVETLGDGSTEVWGTVTGWEPPERVAFTWHPGQPVAEATRVEVTFSAEGAATRLTLVHSGWETRPDGSTARQGYDTGWDLVLAALSALPADASS